MRLLGVEDLRPGDIVAATVFDEDRRVIVRVDTELDEKTIHYLPKVNCYEVPIRFPGFESMDPYPIIHGAVVPRMVKILAQMPPILAVEHLEILLHLLKSIWLYTWSFSGKPVQLLSPMNPVWAPYLGAIERTLMVWRMYTDLPVEEQTALGLASLLLDVGHYGGYELGSVVDYGANPTQHLRLLGDALGPITGFLPRLTRRVLDQQHAYWDNTGWPTLPHDQIQEQARGLQVASGLSYLYRGRGYSAWQGLQAIAQESGGRYDPAAVTQLSRVLNPFRIGTVVQLSTGQFAVVTNSFVGWTMRPTVKILGRHGGLPMDLRDAKCRTTWVQAEWLQRDIPETVNDEPNTGVKEST